MRLSRHASLLLCGCFVLLLSGCATPSAQTPQPPSPVSPALARAEALHQAGRYSDAIVAVSEIARLDPLTPGLPDLQAKIMRTLAEARQQANTRREGNTETRMADDVLARNVLPETYQLKRNVKGETTPLRAAPSKMQEALSKNVTVHLENVDLAAFAAQIAQTEGLNIVADSNLAGSSMTIHAEDTPLVEILEYVGRNLGVTFSVGNNLIWATQSQDQQGTLPLETRVYRLRKGLGGDELTRPQSGGRQASGGQGGRGGRSGAASMVPPGMGGNQEEGTGPSMIDVIGRFVPQAEGADILYNPKAHVLVVRNTRENLAQTEDIIAALDLTPPQVLIEARFISASIDNLSELGMDWIMDSPYAVSTVRQGTKMQVAAGASSAFTAFPNAAQGANFTFQGVLTDPQFRAVVHILESSGKARTLSVPRVTTVNNRPATIRVGEDFRYYEEYDLEEYDTVQGTGDNQTTVTRTQLVPVGTPTLEELGIELAATPSVGADLSSINLALIPEISEFVRWEYYEAASDGGSNDDTDDTTDDGTDVVSGGTGLLKLPVFRRSRIETELVVRSGETVVMGGLITSTRTKQRSGVPILSRLPFIGQLFRHDSIEEARQNLIIFVTATLISEAGEELIPLADLDLRGNELHGGVGATPNLPVESAEAAPAAETAPVAEPAPEAPAVEPPAAPAPEN